MAQNSVIHIAGGGLAGSECALQLAHFGFEVVLYEMRPQQMTPAHKSKDFAELVCSNSFGGVSTTGAPGQLKWEAEQLDSWILKAAKENQVPAGQALGVDREKFAALVTNWVKSHPKIKVVEKTIHSLDEIPRPCVIATGPLTDEKLVQSLQTHFNEPDFLYFFDAIAPIIDADSINMDIAWKADRYDKGNADYINCPMDKETYDKFIAEIQNAKKIEPKHFETTQYFEGCMPLEAMIERGPETPRFGPMKPVGLRNPRTSKSEHAIVQLRQDNKEATAYNIVGFQTRMAYSEQIRIFRMIPGLENAEFLKLGSIHRNLYINSPKLLNRDFSSRRDPDLFFAGQITGVEGYFESTCIGLLVARFMKQKYLEDRPLTLPPRESAMGSLIEAITAADRAEHFQPTNINFGLFLPPSEEDFASDKQLRRDKKYKKDWQIQKAQRAFEHWQKST